MVWFGDVDLFQANVLLLHVAARTFGQDYATVALGHAYLLRARIEARGAR
jgi:hypothetical protein